ncbi:MAG: immune inhibitor A domain-containing protein, partial [Longimicrobiales bacterium]
GSIDWGAYDNDGPDGVPNSGDDDGFVDVLSVVHPTAGAECTRNDLHVWSHPWSLKSRSGVTYSTSTASANGGQIIVNDYAITPVRSCNQITINEIGVFTHELGHGFGLPDLYSTGVGRHAGIGQWGLMGSGNFGCSQASINSARPCHLTAWSKEVLGWVDLELLAAGMDHGTLTLDPVETGGKIYRVDANDGSGDYYLLENRQRLLSDIDLPSPGLMIWRVDPEVTLGQWAANRVNATASRMGVWLQQADGQNDLGRESRGRGDPGDPFPGSTGNQVFHAASNPASVTHDGTTSGLTVTDITSVGQQVQFRLLTRFQAITVQSQGTSGGGGLFTVDGVTQAADPFVFQSAPFEAHVVEAAGGEPAVNGFRNGFSSWDDGSSLARSWVTGLNDAVLVASYGNPEVQFDVELVTPSPGVSPGSIVTTPGSETGWILRSVPVSVLAAPRPGFAFGSWTGALGGMPNPAVVTLDAPASSSAVFSLTYGFEDGTPTELPLVAVDPVDVTFQVMNGNAPVRWLVQGGPLPTGLTFDTNAGTLGGVPLVDGAFAVTLRAIDAIGLQATLDLNISISPPSATLQQMAAPFLLTGEIDPNLALFLDLKGNQDGAYSLGDFRAYVLVAPPSASMIRAPGPTKIVIPVVLREDETIR